MVFSSDLHGNLLQYRKLVDYANENRLDAILIGGDLFLKNKKTSNLDTFNHEHKINGVELHKSYFSEKMLPILQQFKHGKVYVTFGNADLYTDIAHMKEKTIGTNVIVLHNQVFPIEGHDLEIMAYSSIVFTKGNKKDFERFDTKDIADTLKQNVENVYKIKTHGFASFTEGQYLDEILNGEYQPKNNGLNSTPSSEQTRYDGEPDFTHFYFDMDDPQLVNFLIQSHPLNSCSHGKIHGQ